MYLSRVCGCICEEKRAERRNTTNEKLEKRAGRREKREEGREKREERREKREERREKRAERR